MQKLYKYCPEPVGEGFTDWVTFKAPDEIMIERDFTDKRVKKCISNLYAERTGNAWSAEDIKDVLQKESIQQAFKTGGGRFLLVKTLDGEGSRTPFTIIQDNIQLNIFPPGIDKATSIPASEDMEKMVYVLTKIYRQQLNMPSCNSLNKEDK